MQLVMTEPREETLILKRDPNARYTESYNVPFLESEVRSEVPRCGKRG